MSRALIQRDLEALRDLNIEAKALRARLKELTSRKAKLSLAVIAESHGAALTTVQSMASEMGWTQDEKPPLGSLPPYDAYHAR